MQVAQHWQRRIGMKGVLHSFHVELICVAWEQFVAWQRATEAAREAHCRLALVLTKPHSRLVIQQDW